MQVRFYQLTAIGDRAANEDCMARIISDEYVLCVVADGLGGHVGGGLASRYFCDSLIHLATHYGALMCHAPQATLTAWINAAIDAMQRLFTDEILARSAHTTCAILYLDANCALTAHCGDSRIYRFNAHHLVWRTQDHSILQSRLDSGELMNARQLNQCLKANKLTRSINVARRQAVEIHTHPPAKTGETFIVCSDGFWHGVQGAEWLALTQPDSDRQELNQIAKSVLLRASGKSDNVTVQWLRCL